MSNTQSLNGKYVVPSRDIPKIRKAVLSALKKREQDKYNRLKKLYEMVKSSTRKRTISNIEARIERFERFPGGNPERIKDAYQLMWILRRGDRLSKKMFELKYSKSFHHYDPSTGEYVSIRDNVVEFGVEEGNHAVDDVMRDQNSITRIVSKIMVDYFSKMKSPRKYGGGAFMHDEYRGCTIFGVAGKLGEEMKDTAHVMDVACDNFRTTFGI